MADLRCTRLRGGLRPAGCSPSPSTRRPPLAPLAPLDPLGAVPPITWLAALVYGLIEASVAARRIRQVTGHISFRVGAFAAEGVAGAWPAGVSR